MERSADVTRLLVRWNAGDESARDELLPLVYDELKRLASRQLRHEDAGHLLQTTALVHEAYLRLVDQRSAGWQNRTHFFAISAQLMRRILVDHARRRDAAKRGGGRPVTVDVSNAVPETTPLDVLALNDALSDLAGLDPDKARLVELRFFGGLSVDEAAAVLGTSNRSAAREWRLARAWLHARLAPLPT